MVLRAGADGSIEEVAGSPFDPGNDARSMALSADGAYVFVTDRDRHSIETFGLDAGGGLHAVASTPMDVPEAGELVVDAESRYLYAGSMKAGTVEAFTIEATGALTPVPGSPFAAGPRTGALVTTPLAEGPLQAAVLPEADAFAGRPGGRARRRGHVRDGLARHARRRARRSQRRHALLRDRRHGPAPRHRHGRASGDRRA